MWSDEQTEALRRHWADGLSARQIANRIGVKSRNAVIGKAHRLGLPLRGGSSPTANHNRSVAAKARRTRERKPTQRTIVKTIFASEPLPPPVDGDIGRVSFADIAEGQCRYIPGDPRDATPFCGCEAVPGLPYCQRHAQLCYQTPDVRRDHTQAKTIHKFPELVV